VRRIAQHVRSTHGPQVLGDFGAFAGLLHLRDFQDPVLAVSTDGLGTKLLLGLQLGRYDVLGHDLVNLSVNDVLTSGARPLLFVDYIGLHALDHEVVEQLVAGMAAACRENECALLGGETAQLPELYAPGHCDLAGTVVGAVERSELIDGSRVQPGDRVWALPSTGLHTNGYTLARRVVAAMDLQAQRAELQGTLADALMAPHPSYFRAMRPILGNVKAVAHITGGGVPGNLPRVLPEHVAVELEWGTWRVPPIFDVLQEHGGIGFDEMWRVYNLGLGMIFLTDDDPRSSCPDALEIGRVVARTVDADRVILRR